MNILKLKANNANQYWIFDYNDASTDGTCHNPLKQLELQKRKLKKDTAKEKIVELKKRIDTLELDTDDLFTDDEEEESNKPSKSSDDNSKQNHQDKIDKQEKVAFSPKAFYFEDVKFILDMLDIQWIECPAGFDAEQIAAIATNIPIFKENQIDKKMDCVLTPDADCLVFGAKQLIKRDIRKKKLFKYTLSNILKKYELTQDDLIKVSLILGTDFAPKTPRIGPKTVLKKYKEIELSKEQQDAFDSNFMRKLTDNEIKSIKTSIHNQNRTSFSDEKKYETLLSWLELVKNFNRARIEKQFAKLEVFN